MRSFLRLLVLFSALIALVHLVDSLMKTNFMPTLLRANSWSVAASALNVVGLLLVVLALRKSIPRWAVMFGTGLMVGQLWISIGELYPVLFQAPPVDSSCKPSPTLQLTELELDEIIRVAREGAKADRTTASSDLDREVLIWLDIG